MNVDVAALVVGLLGGTAAAALITQALVLRSKRHDLVERRKGRARMLHEDLMHLQSTLARTFYDAEPDNWWQAGWLRPMATSDRDREDLYEALSSEYFMIVANALGWMDYLIHGREAGVEAPNDDELEQLYGRLAQARYALTRVGKFRYVPHDATQMKPREGGRTDGKELPRIDEAQARTTGDETADFIPRHPPAHHPPPPAKGQSR